MKNRHGFICLITVMLAFLQLEAPARASTSPQSDESASAQNQREIQIMEKVLKKLVLENDNRRVDNRVQGIYLPGYGILFDVQLSDNFLMATQEVELRKLYQVEAEKFKTTSKDNLLSIYVDSKPKLLAQDSVRFQERIKDLRIKLKRFFIDFASSTRSLKGEEKIRVNIRLNCPPSLLYFSDSGPAYLQSQEIRSVAQVADLQKHRLGTLSADALGQKIKIETIAADDDRNDLDLIAGIFDTALRSEADKAALILRRSTHGFYIDGFGAVIITEAGTGDGHNFLQALEHYDKAQAIVLGVEKTMQRTQQEKERAMDNQITELLELTGQYGHILKCVKDQESIVIALVNAIDFSGMPANKHYVQVRKADVEKYRKEELDFQQFKSRSRIWKN